MRSKDELDLKSEDGGRDRGKKRVARLAPIKKSGKDRFSIYKGLSPLDNEEDEDLNLYEKRDSILNYYDDGDSDEGYDEDDDIDDDEFDDDEFDDDYDQDDIRELTGDQDDDGEYDHEEEY